jgi:hypothetical protein
MSVYLLKVSGYPQLDAMALVIPMSLLCSMAKLCRALNARFQARKWTGEVNFLYVFGQVVLLGCGYSQYLLHTARRVLRVSATLGHSSLCHARTESDTRNHEITDFRLRC